jgi:hypothetical protein
LTVATNWLTNKARYDALYAYLNGATLKCLLLDDSFTPSKDHVFASALTHELTCAGYVRKTLGTVVISQDDTLDLGKLAAADVVWDALGPATAGPTVGYAALIKFVTTDADSPVIAILDVAKATNGGAFTLSKHVVNAAFLWLA